MKSVTVDLKKMDVSETGNEEAPLVDLEEDGDASNANASAEKQSNSSETVASGGDQMAVLVQPVAVDFSTDEDGDLGEWTVLAAQNGSNVNANGRGVLVLNVFTRFKLCIFIHCV